MTKAVAQNTRALDDRRFLSSPADALLRAAFSETDFLGQGYSEDGLPRVFLLVMLDRDTFTALCNYGAESEDLEDAGDREPNDGTEETPGIGRHFAGGSEDDEEDDPAGGNVEDAGEADYSDVEPWHVPLSPFDTMTVVSPK